MSAIISRAADGGREGGGGRAFVRISSITRCNSFRASPSIGLVVLLRARERELCDENAAFANDSDGGLWTQLRDRGRREGVVVGPLIAATAANQIRKSLLDVLSLNFLKHRL